MHPTSSFTIRAPRRGSVKPSAKRSARNRDLSHSFWQGCYPVEVIHFLAKKGIIDHVHMKDTVSSPGKRREIDGILNFVFETGDLPRFAMPSAPSVMATARRFWKSSSRRTWTSATMQFSASKTRIDSERGSRRGTRCVRLQFGSLVMTVGHRTLHSAPLNTYTTADGWECIGVLSPLEGAYLTPALFGPRRGPSKCLTPYFIASCPEDCCKKITGTTSSAQRFYHIEVPLHGWRTHATRRVMPSH